MLYVKLMKFVHGENIDLGTCVDFELNVAFLRTYMQCGKSLIVMRKNVYLPYQHKIPTNLNHPVHIVHFSLHAQFLICKHAENGSFSRIFYMIVLLLNTVRSFYAYHSHSFCTCFPVPVWFKVPFVAPVVAPLAGCTPKPRLVCCRSSFRFVWSVR